jgi:hypothetical protein
MSPTLSQGERVVAKRPGEGCNVASMELILLAS